MPARKISKGSLAYEVNAALKKSRIKAKKQRRNAKRVEQGKKPLAQPLTIAAGEERIQALRKGKMVFYDGKKRIELPLSQPVFGRGYLQGVYKVGNKIILLRSFTKWPPLANYIARKFHAFELKENSEKSSPGFFYRKNDLAHMFHEKETGGRGFGLKAASKAERDQRARQEGVHLFEVNPESQFIKGEPGKTFFEKLGYRILRRSGRVYLVKEGKLQPKDDMDKFHRIEALDKNGKARIFTFKIKSDS